MKNEKRFTTGDTELGTEVHGGNIRNPMRYFCLLFVFLFTLNSCIGISADIQMRRDGSGKIALEYRFSQMAETVGKQDGNERWQIIPVGRADWERTVARVDGIKLASFSSRSDKNDIVNRVALEFNNTDALLKFLDPAGKRAYLKSENGANSLYLILNEPASSQDAELLALMKQVSAGYKVNIRFSAQGNSALAITDGSGNALANVHNAQAVSQGKKVSLAIDTGELLSREDGLGVIISWK